MRRLVACLIVSIVAGPLAGCSSHGIEMGIPKNAQPPKDFDPGGDVKPDMTGKAQAKPTRPR